MNIIRWMILKLYVYQDHKNIYYSKGNIVQKLQ